MLVAPLTVYAGIKVSITFNYVLGGAQVYTQSFTFGGGAYLMTSAAQCLTTLQVDSIIENTTQICGCAGCTQNEDTTPQANAVVINNVVSSIAVVNISSADFSGNNYQNNLLIGKVPGTDFDVFTFPSVGLGALLHVNDGYSFNAGTGTLTMPPGDYKIIIYNA